MKNRAKFGIVLVVSQINPVYSDFLHLKNGYPFWNVIYAIDYEMASDNFTSIWVDGTTN